MIRRLAANSLPLWLRQRLSTLSQCQHASSFEGDVAGVTSAIRMHLNLHARSVPISNPANSVSWFGAMHPAIGACASAAYTQAVAQTTILTMNRLTQLHFVEAYCLV